MKTSSPMSRISMRNSRADPREAITAAAAVEAEVMVTGDMAIAVKDTVTVTVTITVMRTHTKVDMITIGVTTVITRTRPTVTATRPLRWLGLLSHPPLPSLLPLSTILLLSTHSTRPAVPLAPLTRMPHMAVMLRKSRFLVNVMATYQCSD